MDENISISIEQAIEIVKNQTRSFWFLELSQIERYFYSYQYMFDVFFRKFIPSGFNGKLNRKDMDSNFNLFYNKFENIKDCKLFKIEEFKFLDSAKSSIPIIGTSKFLKLIEEKNTCHKTKIERIRTVYTYLMIDKSNNAVKIGKSVNPLKRERTLQSEKISIKLIYAVDKDIENKLHKKYRDKRIRGEWFRLTKKDIHCIISKYGFIEASEIQKKIL